MGFLSCVLRKFFLPIGLRWGKDGKESGVASSQYVDSAFRCC